MGNDISKFMCLLLRHKPEVIGLNIRPDGYADIDELIEKINNHGEYKLDREKLIDIVNTDNKKRYQISEDGKHIRCVQGHSIKVDIGLEPKIPPDVLYHGTSLNTYKGISKDGIKSMSRNYVHLSKDKATAKVVGMRHAKSEERVIIIAVKAKKMTEDGYKFYRAENGVWLTDKVPAEYVEMSKCGAIAYGVKR